MVRCGECGHPASLKPLPEYKDKHLGVPIILVNSVEQRVCDVCGSVVSTRIPDQEGLVAAMAVVRVMYPMKLNSDEIRFLRKALNCTGKELAKRLEVTPETVSRWENGKEPIGPQSEKILRLVVGATLSKNAPAIDFVPEGIVDMKIQSVRLANEIVVMTFERGPMKMPNQPRQKFWGESDKTAA